MDSSKLTPTEQTARPSARVATEAPKRSGCRHSDRKLQVRALITRWCYRLMPALHWHRASIILTSCRFQNPRSVPKRLCAGARSSRRSTTGSSSATLAIRPTSFSAYPACGLDGT